MRNYSGSNLVKARETWKNGQAGGIGRRPPFRAQRVASQIDEIETQIKEVANLPWGRSGLTEIDRRSEFRRLLKRVPAILEISRYDSAGRETLHVSRLTEDRVSDSSAPPLARWPVPVTLAFSNFRPPAVMSAVCCALAA